MFKKLLALGFVALMFSGCYFSDNLHQHADGNITLIISVDDNNSWDYLQEKVAETQ